MIVRTFPLRLRCHVMFYRGGSRFAAGPIRMHEKSRARTIGATLSIARFTIGVAEFGRPHQQLTGGHWYRDFGRGCQPGA
ncbi:hypothetical protein ACFU8W_49505 [Streptomyces sp. NPDC057565]|uniref:hypothetical protein n=1 Tax=Streptomyces sp. NPDC057565 TaxID=3346169 RepID=UPI0036B5A643